MGRFVHDPDAALRVVGADTDAVWSWPVGTFKEIVPLVPDFGDVTVAVEDVNAVLPGTATSTENVPLWPGPAIELWRHWVGKPGLSTL